jgi:hypothetical protein
MGERSRHEDTPNGPEGVDPALWAEFRELSAKVHELHRLREIDEVAPPPPTRRMVLDVPEEWFLLFAWHENRLRLRRQGQNGATGLTPERIALSERFTRKIVSRYMWRALNNDFHAELHLLATGASDLLRPEPPRPARPTHNDSNDRIPV